MSTPADVVVLSEVPVSPEDARTALRYLGLEATGDDAEPSTPHVHVLVPRDSHRSVIAEVIDALGLIDVRGAWQAVADRSRHRRAEADRHAHEVLDTVLAALRDAGCDASGTLTDDDPLDAVRAELAEGSPQAVVVFSDPQILEETFARDWAHRVEDHLHVPVLHLYPGSTMIGGS